MSKKNKFSRAKNKTDNRLLIREDLTADDGSYMKDGIKHKIKELKWTPRQIEFIKLALDPKVKIIFVNGPAGTSKTLLAVYCGLRMLNDCTLSELMYIRSAVESSDSRLGYLPGSADEKLQFYNLPFLDKLVELTSNEQTLRLEKEKKVSMFPVNFSRGLNWCNKCVIFDEAQNSSAKEITTVLTRLGRNSKCFILADPMQTDLNKHCSGFEGMYSLFSDEDSKANGVYAFQFTEEDVMRSDLVKFLVRKMKKLNVKA